MDWKKISIEAWSGARKEIFGSRRSLWWCGLFCTEWVRWSKKTKKLVDMPIKRLSSILMQTFNCTYLFLSAVIVSLLCFSCHIDRTSIKPSQLLPSRLTTGISSILVLFTPVEFPYKRVEHKRWNMSHALLSVHCELPYNLFSPDWTVKQLLDRIGGSKL